MNRYLVSGAVVAGPVLVCMAAVIYILSPPSDRTDPQLQANAVHAEAPARSGPSGDGSWLARISKAVVPSLGDPSAQPRSTTAAVEETAALSEAEQAAHLEEQAFSELSDLQTRAEALVALAQVDASRGENALASMIASDSMDDRHLAVSLLREWHNRTGDPDGRITALLRQAASDPDAGVAYQARVALDPAENYGQIDSTYSPDGMENAYQDASAE